ncbi:winged helix-turn-helix transcriptional regulator [Streptomyces sp. NPDC002018]|uniref:winged helix-turn-helix transcriptional regulator n=1 Tax=Streptomyces sp. NPDC002018 TaxID=3364629 RepID=UPI0036CB0B67
MKEEGTSMWGTNIDVRALERSGEVNAWMRGILARVTDKWGVLIMAVLSHGPLRYAELHRHVNEVSQRMLTLTLRRLERDGLIIRTVTPDRPPQVEYTLSEVGRSLYEQMLGLLDWALAQENSIRESRKRFDAAYSDGSGIADGDRDGDGGQA